jgi:hypothetical protein
MKSSTIVICLGLVLLLGFVFLIAHQHGAGHRRLLVSAVTHHIDVHSAKIATLLATMSSSNVMVVEDAAFQELQAGGSLSLLVRSMIRVAPTSDGRLECVIDTSSLGVAPRTIRSSQ